jgi:hypothetical protein
MAVDEWHYNGPQDFITVSLFIQIVIDKMQLCSLSICEEPGCGYTWFVVRLVGRTDIFSKTTFEAAYGSKMNIHFSGSSSGGHSCSQHGNCTLPQLETCAVWQNYTF